MGETGSWFPVPEMYSVTNRMAMATNMLPNAAYPARARALGPAGTEPEG